MEYQVEINGVSYDEDDLFSVEIHRSLFSTLSVGNTCCSGARSLANRARSVSNITPA